MKDMVKYKELSKQLCEITELLTWAKAILDKTGSPPIPKNVYDKLVAERQEIREQLYKV